MRPVCGLAFIAVVVAFGSAARAAQDAAIPSDLLIKLERTACYGSCPVYSVTLDAKGNVSFSTTKGDGAVVQHTDRIAASEVAAVLATARRIGFFEMRDSYRAMITDLPTTFVTITANGQTKKIEDYFGAPRELKQLEILIDEAARTQRWLKMAAPQGPAK
jgi:hypothetical protein